MSAFDPDRVYPDNLAWGYDPHLDVQAFFVSHGSCLAGYKPDGVHLAGEIIRRECEKHDTDARGLLVRLQVEQSLVSKKVLPLPGSRALNYSLGFGALDGGDIKQFKGFENQVRGYTEWWAKHKADFTAKVGKKFVTGEGRAVHPANAASVGLYRYTPYVGDQDRVVSGISYKKPFGCLLVHMVATKYFPF